MTKEQKKEILDKQIMKGAKGVHIADSYLKFYSEELKGGCTVYFIGTFQIDGDFGTFSKIVNSLQMTKEQRESFETESEEFEYYEEFSKLISKNNDGAIIDFDIIEF